MSEETEADVILRTGAAIGSAKAIAPLCRYAVVPDGYTLADLEQFLPEPIRRRATVSLTHPESFVAYATDFQSSLILFASQSAQNVTAVLDYHASGTDGAASRCSHVAKLSLKYSPEWDRWKASDGKQMQQVAFAEFLEDNLPDIVEPDGATILEAATRLEATKTVKFKQGVNLSSGECQLTYEEAIEGKGKGTLVVPTAFTIGIPVYEGGEGFKVKVRLRYRINDDRLTFTYILDRPHKIVEAAFGKVLEFVEAGTGIKPLLGSWTNG